MKYKYKKMEWRDLKERDIMICVGCNTTQTYMHFGTPYYIPEMYKTSFGITCEWCIEKLEQRNPDWACGLEALK